MLSAGRKRPHGANANGRVSYIPPITGFHWNLYTDARIFSGTFTAGTIVSRVTREVDRFTLISGFGYTPTGHKPYLRALILHYETEEGESTGIALEGNGFSPEIVHVNDLRLSSHTDQSKTARYLELSAYLKPIMEGLRLAGALKEGCLVHLPTYREMFNEGKIDSLLSDALAGSDFTLATQCDPDSLEQVTDLDFEIGTGIADTANQESLTTIVGKGVWSTPMGTTLFKRLRPLDLINMLEAIDVVRAHRGFDPLSAPSRSVLLGNITGVKDHGQSDLFLCMDGSWANPFIDLDPDGAMSNADLHYRPVLRDALRVYSGLRGRVKVHRLCGSLWFGARLLTYEKVIGAYSVVTDAEMSLAQWAQSEPERIGSG